MNEQINLIELLSLFSPCGDFPSSNYKINVYDFANSKVNIRKPLQDFIKSYYAPNPDLSFNNLVEGFWIDPKSDVLTVYIDSSEYKSTCDDFIKIKTLVKFLDPRQTIRVSYWSFGCDNAANLIPDYFSSRIYSNVESFEAYDMSDAFVTNLTVQHFVEDKTYVLVINAFASTTLTRLHELADYKKPLEAPSHD